MTRSISSCHLKPSHSPRQGCAVLARLWMLTAWLGLSVQAIHFASFATPAGVRPFDLYGSKEQKFNLFNTKSGWCFRLTPI
ncbi:hypothetical protein H6F89_17570 [Cyanobacteria bacterium FACHB-63]|nr:hypothetical protein [Cyanobacteria bacterium FACHB-63]